MGGGRLEQVCKRDERRLPPGAQDFFVTRLWVCAATLTHIHKSTEDFYHDRIFPPLISVSIILDQGKLIRCASTNKFCGRGLLLE